MTLLRRSEPSAEHFRMEMPSDAECLVAARRVLEDIGTKRRRRLRIVHAIQIGTAFGFVAFFLSSILWRRGGHELQYSVAIFNGMGVVLSYIGAIHRAPRTQVDALGTLVPLAEKADLPWLLEGTQYANSNELYSSLLQKIKLLLSTLEPADGIYLPEGARKILRGWVWSTYHPEPETALLVLQALLRIEDPKMLRDCARLARRKLDFPGDDQIRQLAARAAGIALKAEPTPTPNLQSAVGVIAQRRKNNRRGNLRDLTLGSLTVLALCAGIIRFAHTGNGLWMIPGSVLLVLSVCLGVTALIVREANSYAYRQALLALAAQGHSADHRKLLQDGLVTIGSGQNRETLEKAIERLDREIAPT